MVTLSFNFRGNPFGRPSRLSSLTLHNEPWVAIEVVSAIQRPHCLREIEPSAKLPISFDLDSTDVHHARQSWGVTTGIVPEGKP